MTEIDCRIDRSRFGQVVRVVVQLRDISDQDSRKILFGDVACHDFIADMYMVVIVRQLNQ